RLVRVLLPYSENVHRTAFCFTAVDRKDYVALFRPARRCYRKQAKEPALAPVLTVDQRRILWQNTIGFLETANRRRYQAYGTRARRGVLLMGAPGNGKTMACRWIMEECRQRGWEWKLVTPDCYRQA